jgi:ABC-type Fe3+-hydroxamate transport system substrate-binding protein
LFPSHDPQGREKILQEIEELGLMSDQANERAEEIIAQYESKQPKSKDG